MYLGKDVNDCTPEETDAGKCWKINPARMATETDDSNLNGKSFLRAYGKRSSKKSYDKESFKLTFFKKSSGLLSHPPTHLPPILLSYHY